MQLLVSRRQIEEEIGQLVVQAIAAGKRVVWAPEPAAATDDEPELPTPTSPPADAAKLQALLAHGLQQGTPDRPTAREHAEDLAHTTERMGRPEAIRDPAGAGVVLYRLEAAADALDDWLRFSKPVQRALLGLAAAQARALQLQASSDAGTQHRIDVLFKALSRWSKRHQPGSVNGLARHHQPSRGTWLAEAEAYWLELRGPEPDRVPFNTEIALGEIESALASGAPPEDVVELVQDAVDRGLSQSDKRLVAQFTPWLSWFQGLPGLKTLKNALKRSLESEDEAQDEADATTTVPADWRWWHLTRGRRAVMLGGDARPRTRKRLKVTFGFSELTWEDMDTRRVEALAERVQAGSVDLVIFLRRYLSHKHEGLVKRACQQTGTHACLVDSGYGVTQVRLAMERDLAAYAR